MAKRQNTLAQDQQRHQRALALLRAGDAPGAEKEVRRLLKRQPKDPALNELLGLVLLRREQPDRAVAALKAALKGGAGEAGTYNNLALALNGTGDLEGALEASRAAVRLAPGLAEFQVNLGNRLKAVGRMDQARDAYQQALTLRPDLISARVALGHLEAAMGARQAAIDHYHQALAARPDLVAAFYPLALTEKSGQSALDQATVAHFEALARSGRLAPLERAMVHNGLGHLAERDGRFDQAFGHFDQANRARKALAASQGAGHDRAAHSQQIDHLIAAYPATVLAQSAPGASDSARPILIVGLPRSGTTLVEQVLANHPAVAPGGERLALPLVEQALPADPRHWRTAQVEAQAARYLADLSLADSAAARVSDKLPVNFLRLGLFARLFPRARIVHVKRDPRDSCLSCFQQNFARAHGFSHDLTDLGAYARDYGRLMAHWTQVLPVAPIELAYEDLVRDPEPSVRRLLAALDLEWAPQCLALEQARNPVLTASQWQVRRAINDRSVGRWRAYQAHLAPLLAALGDLVEPAG